MEIRCEKITSAFEALSESFLTSSLVFKSDYPRSSGEKKIYKSAMISFLLHKGRKAKKKAQSSNYKRLRVGLAFVTSFL